MAAGKNLARPFQFFVVEFPEENGDPLSAVPGVWLAHNNKYCYWPDHLSDSVRFKAAVGKKVPDKEQWQLHPVNLKYKAYTMEKALAKIKQLENGRQSVTAEDTDLELTASKKRKRYSTHSTAVGTTRFSSSSLPAPFPEDMPSSSPIIQFTSPVITHSTPDKTPPLKKLHATTTPLIRSGGTPPATQNATQTPLIRSGGTPPATQNATTTPLIRSDKTPNATRKAVTTPLVCSGGTPPATRNAVTTPLVRSDGTPTATRNATTTPLIRSGGTPPATRNATTTPLIRSDKTPTATRNATTTPLVRSGGTLPATRNAMTTPLVRSGRTPPSRRNVINNDILQAPECVNCTNYSSVFERMFSLLEDQANELRKQSATLASIQTSVEALEASSSDPAPRPFRGELNDAISGLPCSSVQDLLGLNEVLKDPNELKKRVIVLGLLGGRDVTSAVWSVLLKVITKSLAEQLNWKGVNGKRSIQDFPRVLDMISLATKQSYPKAQFSAIHNIIKPWLRGARDREGCRANRLKVRQAQSQTAGLLAAGCVDVTQTTHLRDEEQQGENEDRQEDDQATKKHCEESTVADQVNVSESDDDTPNELDKVNVSESEEDTENELDYELNYAVLDFEDY